MIPVNNAAGKNGSQFCSKTQRCSASKQIGAKLLRDPDAFGRTPRIDCAMIKSHFDGSAKAYLDWICVLKSARHRGVAQALLAELRARLRERQVDTLIALTAANEEAQRFYKHVPRSLMRDTGIWIYVP